MHAVKVDFNNVKLALAGRLLTLVSCAVRPETRSRSVGMIRSSGFGGVGRVYVRFIYSREREREREKIIPFIIRIPYPYHRTHVSFIEYSFEAGRRR